MFFEEILVECDPCAMMYNTINNEDNVAIVGEIEPFVKQEPFEGVFLPVKQEVQDEPLDDDMQQEPDSLPVLASANLVDTWSCEEKEEVAREYATSSAPRRRPEVRTSNRGNLTGQQETLAKRMCFSSHFLLDVGSAVKTVQAEAPSCLDLGTNCQNLNQEESVKSSHYTIEPAEVCDDNVAKDLDYISTCFKPYTCVVCAAKFTHRYNLQQHMLMHIDEKPFTWPLLPSKSSNKSSSLKKPITARTVQKPFSCPMCVAVFSRKSHLKDHIFTHTGEKPFHCNLCPAKFSNNSALKHHIHTHSNEKPFSCALCNSTFSHKSYLRKHILTHAGQKPFSCTECSARFSYRSSLKHHRLAHSGQKPFPCPECSARFSKKSALKQHVLIHSVEKPFPCSKCPASFCHQSYLRKHLLTHSSGKPFSCTVCSAKFSYNSSLKRHMYTAHWHSTQVH